MEKFNDKFLGTIVYGTTEELRKSITYYSDMKSLDKLIWSTSKEGYVINQDNISFFHGILEICLDKVSDLGVDQNSGIISNEEFREKMNYISGVIDRYRFLV